MNEDYDGESVRIADEAREVLKCALLERILVSALHYKDLHGVFTMDVSLKAARMSLFHDVDAFLREFPEVRG